MAPRASSSLDQLEKEINQAQGVPLDVERILRDSRSDPVLGRLEEILDGRIGPPFEDDEPFIAEGLRRFGDSVPPGYIDGQNKASQIPERGTGDYLMWEQTLRHVSDLSAKSEALVLVTNDTKADWRIHADKRQLGVRPELVTEALQRTGRRLALLRAQDLYRLMLGIRSGDEAASESLVEASRLAEDERQQGNQPTWLQAAAIVGASAPERVWTVGELVSEIREQGLRDLSEARTPEKTLRRDLDLRGSAYFERVDGGFKLLNH